MNDETANISAAGAEPSVSGGRCGDCGHFSLPLPRICPSCMSEALTPASVSGDGTVYASTVVRHGRKDRPLPYGLAYVDLVSGLRVMAAYEVQAESLDPGATVVVAETGRSEADLPLLEVVERRAS